MSERAAQEMINGTGKDREGEPIVPGRDVIVVRLHAEDNDCRTPMAFGPMGSGKSLGCSQW